MRLKLGDQAVVEASFQLELRTGPQLGDDDGLRCNRRADGWPAEQRVDQG
jgi:hypothetical protein